MIDNLAWTPRFKSQLERYTGIQDFVINRTAELLRKAQSDPNTWHRYEEKLKDDSFGSLQVYKTAVTSGDRLVFVVDEGKIILVDIGKHEVMDNYARMSRKNRQNDVNSNDSVESWFRKKIDSKLKVKNTVKNNVSKLDKKNEIVRIIRHEIDVDDFRYVFDEELDEKWILFLDEMKSKVADAIFSNLREESESMQIHYILGGPGTGKTVVLLNLAKRFENDQRAISFQLSPSVLKYLNSGPTKVPSVNLGMGPGVVLLVDDPVDMGTMKGILRQARSSKCKAVVIALDPIQWHEKDMPETFEKIWSEFENTTHKLDVCYRQSAGVAKKQLQLYSNLIEKNSRFLIHEKQKKEKIEIAPYLNLSLDMKFVDQAGRWKVYEEDTRQNFINEINRFRNREYLWKHTPPIAFIYSDDIDKEVKDTAKKYAQGLSKIEYALSDYKKVRGVEFQELFIFIDHDSWFKMNEGHKGLSSSEYQKVSSLYTWFSRPKDGLVIFVI
jgi:Txe/YoeB family toxin of Txe-Axe toxin-antitoxin module